MDNNVFTVKNLSFAYGKQQVLKNLDLELHEGKITTLIGANGCGKSTLFNLMTKNLKPDEGEILLRGGDIAGMRLKDFAKEVSIVHQYNTAPVDLSVEKLVGYGRTPYHTFPLIPRRTRKKSVGRWRSPIHTSIGINRYPSFPAGRSSGCGSPWRWRRIPGCCSSTNPPPIWISGTSCKS